MKLSSRHKTSGCVDPCGKDGLRGEFGVVWLADETMPHIGQPSFGEKAIWFDDVDSSGE